MPSAFRSVKERFGGKKSKSRNEAEKIDLTDARRQAGIRTTVPSKVFIEMLSAEGLKSLRKDLDRGSLDLKIVKLGKGLGEFEDVVDATDRLAAAMTVDDAKKRREACDELLRVLNGYQTQARNTAFDEESAKKDQGGKFDQKTINKHNAVMNLRRGAQLVVQDLIDQEFLVNGSKDAKALEEAHQRRAQELGSAFGKSRSETGTSDVQLVKDCDDKVAYAFKSVKGESTMMGTPQGHGTSREVMMSGLMQQLNKHGLGLGWPAASIAELNGEKGALITGVQGKQFPELNKEDIPAEALQKVLLSNLAGGQFDIKWEDARFVQNGDKLEPTCMDGGAAMPDPWTAITMLYGQTGGDPGQNFIDDGTGKVLPEAKKKMSPDLVNNFLKIPVKEVKKEMEAQASRLKSQLGDKDLGLDDGIQTAIDSITGIQDILIESNGDISLQDLLAQFHQRVIQAKFVAPHKDEWEAVQLKDYQKLIDVYPGLFKPASKVDDVPELFRSLLHPERKQKLQALADHVADFRKKPEGASFPKTGTLADFLRKYGVPLPIAQPDGVLDKVKTALKAVSDGTALKKYRDLVKTYPGVIVDSLSAEDAYGPVITHDLALKQMAAEAKRLSISLAELLRQHGFKTPTTDFKPKWEEIAEKGLAAYDRLMQQYPGAIVERKEISAYQAYVLVVLQEDALRGLDDIARRIGKKRGKDMSVAELLALHYKTPAYDFQDKLRFISAREDPTTATV